MSLLAGLVDQCNDISATHAMECSRRQAVVSVLPPFPWLLEHYSSQLIKDTVQEQVSLQLKLFNSMLNLALAHGPTGDSEEEQMETVSHCFEKPPFLW